MSDNKHLDAIVGEDQPETNQVISNYQKTESGMKVKVSITRHYGSVSVELGAEMDIFATNPEHLSNAYSDLYDHVINEHKTMAARLASAARPPAGESSAGTDSKTKNHETPAEIAVDFLTVDFKQNKRYYLVKGGIFSKFGVRLWLDPKVIEAVRDEITFSKLEIGDNVPPVPLVAEIAYEGTIPKRVNRLRLATKPEEVKF